MMAEDLTLSPGWNRPFQSTIISPPKEQQLDKILQIVNNKIKPTSPARRRTRSQDPKETPINAEQKISNQETQPNHGKANPKKGANQHKQNHKENARASRINRSLNKGKTPKQNPDSKTKDNSKEQNKEDKNKEEQDTTLNIVTSTPT